MYGRSYQTRRRQTEDSSAFEHIFVGESRDGEVLGFHNWMRFYQLEKNGYIDYKGFYVSKLYSATIKRTMVLLARLIFPNNNNMYNS